MLAGGDSSLALVAAMHPAVLSYWLCLQDEAQGPLWDRQLADIVESVRQGAYWGTMTSEPGTGGDVSKTRTKATPASGDLAYVLTGQKHFGSGSGIMSYMVTSARAVDDDQPDWFFLDVQGVPWDGSQGLTQMAEWDGHGMTATQSHAMSLEAFPATRIAQPGRLGEIASRTGGFIGCLFTAVIVGIVDIAMQTAREQLAGKTFNAYQETEWTRCRLEHWLIEQAFEGMQRSVSEQVDSRGEILLGKTAIAELAESVTLKLTRIIGGSTFSRRSPFGYWFEDVRALGFLRPPWALAMQTLSETRS